MTVIKSAEIPYLNEEVLEQYTNVAVVSIEGLIVRMNPLLLCAMSPSLRKAMNENDDDLTIVTEFTFEELKQVKYFCMTGTCDSTHSNIIHSFGLRNPKQVLVKNEVIEVKIEPVDYNVDDDKDYDPNHDDLDDFDYEPEAPIVKKRIKSEKDKIKKSRKTSRESKPLKKKKVKLPLPEFDDDSDGNNDESWKSEGEQNDTVSYSRKTKLTSSDLGELLYILYDSLKDSTILLFLV